MSLETLRERDVVKVVKRVDGRPQALVVFLLNEQIVQRLVDRLVVVVLLGNITAFHPFAKMKFPNFSVTSKCYIPRTLTTK